VPDFRGDVISLAVVTSGIEIEIRHVDLVSFEGDGIVVPTNSYGLMVDGHAADVKAVAGEEVEAEATSSAPIAVGAAIGTDPGRLSVQKLIHVPVVEQPGLRVGIENVRRATRAGLLAANHFELATIAIPGFGYGENGIPYDETARAILDEVRAFRNPYPTKVVLVSEDGRMLRAFRQMVDEK
jgi:O-acetyl-ADP-ribose deacetylase (regulator of RNase III)